MLVYKGNWYGWRVVKASQWYPSSKTCSACGAVMQPIPFNAHEWQCPVCGVVHDRDVYAAIRSDLPWEPREVTPGDSL
jgi:putative transposase